MNNFEKAKNIIEEYRKLRLDKDAKDNFKLQEKLTEIGYTEQQFIKENNKIEIDKLNIFNDIKINYCDVNNIQESISNQFKEKDNSILFNIPTKKAIYTGNGEYNKEFCVNNNITILDLGYSGGTIVFGEDDLGISIVLNEKIEQSFLTEKIAEIITKLFKQVTISGNDILIDGYKICGSVYIDKNNKHSYMYQISFNTDIDLIKNICVKEMVKIPKSLNCFGNKTREDFINEIKLWLQQ